MTDLKNPPSDAGTERAVEVALKPDMGMTRRGPRKRYIRKLSWQNSDEWERPGDGSVIVPLTRGKFAIIDECDVEIIKGHVWHTTSAGNYKKLWYAKTTVVRKEGNKGLFMHNLLVDASGMYPDHKDGNGLNNRRSNLRPATKSQNSANIRPRADGKFRGVSFDRKRAKWRSRIYVNKRMIRGPYTSTPEQAAQHYDAMAIEHFGEFARPNFPGRDQAL